MKFPSCFSHVLLLVFSLAAPQILGAQSKAAATPATKPGAVKTNLTAQPGQGTTPVIQYYSDNDLLPVTEEISRVDLEEAKWQAVPVVSDLLTAERDAVAQIIASPDFDQHKLPTYRSYDRVLSYIQQSLPEQEPVGQIADKSYLKVLKEAETDAELAGYDPQVLEMFCNTFFQTLKSN